MTTPESDNAIPELSTDFESGYHAPRLRKLKLAADEILSTGCKVAGVCDVPGDGFNNAPTGS